MRSSALIRRHPYKVALLVPPRRSTAESAVVLVVMFVRVGVGDATADVRRT